MTTAGLWIASPPFLSSTDDASPIGECVARSLTASTEGIPHPTEWNNLFRPILELAGVKSWNSFVKGALLVGIESDSDQITLTPHRTLGARDGFEPIQKYELRLSVTVTTKVLGEALLETVKHCA
jgi:hypothetical protein